MKKRIVLLLAVAVLTATFFGASLKVWTVYKEDMAAYQALTLSIEQFEANTGHSVDIVSIPDQTDMDSKMQIAAPTGMGPDVIATMPHDIIGKWANQGILLALNGKADMEPFFDSTIRAITYEGKMYGFPLSVESVGLVYNKAFVLTAPQTFEEMIPVMERMEQDGLYGLVFPSAEPYHMYGILSGFGGYIFGWENDAYNVQDIGMNNEGANEAIAYLKSFFERGLFPDSMRDRNTQHGFSTGTFEQGKAAFQINGPWVLAGLDAAGMDYGVAPIPVLPNGEYPHPFLGVQFIGISAYSKNTPAAIALAEFLTGKEQMASYALQTTLTPTRQDVLEDARIAQNEMIGAWAQQASLGTPMPNIPEMSAVWSAWSDALQVIYFDRGTISETLDELAETISEKIQIMRK